MKTFLDFFESIIRLLTMPPVIYLGAVAFTATVFSFMRSLVGKYRVKTEWAFILLIVFNGMITTFLLTSENPFITSINPSIIVLIIPALTVLEFMLTSRDKIRTYIFMLSLIMLQLACIFGICTAIVTVSPVSIQTVGLGGIRTAALVLTLFLLSLSLGIFSFFTRGQRRMMQRLFHNKFGGAAFIYILINGLVLAVTVGFDYQVYFTDSAINPLRTPTITGMVLRYLLIMTTSILLIYMQCRMEASHEMAEVLTGDLDMERRRRESTREGSVFDYSVNITRDRMTQGREAFSDALWKGTNLQYHRMFKRFLDRIVHPDDRHVFYDTEYRDVKDHMVDNAVNVEIKFRYSPKAVLDNTNLSEAQREGLYAIDKEWAWGELIKTYVVDEKSKNVMLYVEVRDIDAQEEAWEQLETAASTDKLTGLYNRASLEIRVKDIMSQKDENPKFAEGAMFIMDLDFFKEVNDNLGHPVGDEMLKKAAEAIKGVFRENDVVARLGGDEFCVYMAGDCSDDIIRSKATMLNDRVRFHYRKPNGGDINTTVSIGIARFPSNGMDYEELYQNADEALYKVKQNGRNGYELLGA